MNELIKIDEKKMVDARELHAFLEVKTRWDLWIQRRIEEYGLVQPTDFIAIKNDLNDFTDFRLTLDTAKELCMVERNEKGKMARRYFIEIEKRWKDQQPSMTPAEMLLASAQRLVETERQMALMNQKLDVIGEQVRLMAADSEYRTVRAMAKQLGINISREDANKVGRRTAALCRQRQIVIGKVPDERDGAVNSYPIQVLRPVLEAWNAGVLN